MATVTAQTALPDNGGVFSTANLAQVQANVTTQNTNNTNLNADIATNTAAIAANTASIVALGAGVTYHAKYSFAVDGGAISTITVTTNSTIPANFVIQNFSFNCVTAGASLGSATVSAGLSAGGGGAAALMAATAVASLTTNAFIQGKPVPQDVTKWIKMSAQGSVTVTIAVAALTAGIFEMYLFGYLSAS